MVTCIIMQSKKQLLTPHCKPTARYLYAGIDYQCQYVLAKLVTVQYWPMHDGQKHNVWHCVTSVTLARFGSHLSTEA